jgi:hypothetical protein
LRASLPAVALAQLVEHWIVDPRVTGSSPVCHPIFSRVAVAVFAVFADGGFFALAAEFML